MTFRKILLSLLMLGVLTACSSDGGKKDQQEPQPAETLYQKAAKAMQEEDYKNATTFFEEVERQHPYSALSTKAQLMAAYSSYLDQRYDEAIVALDRYIELHPGAPDVDYAFYLKAISYYEQISDVRRDQQMTVEALKSLNTLIQRFPNSEYSRDAELKRDLVLDHLAGKEMEVGRYYLNRNHINAAINRFRSVIVNFQTTTHVPEALHRLVECYMILGLEQEALQVAMVLGYNYPGSVWYERTYELLTPELRKKVEDGRGVVTRTIETLLKPD
ncbi:MAG: outer membrane protein assembly factor BamD [Rhodospirillales bacterium]|nr:outer membrane protein assembly factor BamD [Alphaproteobacteria bacterium]MCB1839062.1 outer membrane protein assembly factor BamD [Alphaproteobacteria bacterium]MCB9976377.1 outer membrane protein assembly factor BamD [Rhodospirillales bacterium]